MDTETTVVMFRKWRAKPKTVIALFPYIPGTNDPGTCQSYEHMGQHGSADPLDVIERTRPASPEECAPLMRELESAPFGYRLAVRHRTPPDAYGVRRAEVRRS